MHKIKVTIILLFVIGVYGCNNHENYRYVCQNGKHFDVKTWDIENELSENIIRNIRFVPLETKEECFVGKIDKVIVQDDKIFILDKSNKKILIFSLKGNFMRKIGNYGRGPGEFISINDFAFHHNQIYILDSQLRKIIKYSLDNPDDIYEIKLDFWASNFLLLEENILSFFMKNTYSKNPKGYSIVNVDISKKNQKSFFLEKDPYDVNLSYNSSLFQSQNSYYAPYLKDAIYIIKSNSVKRALTFDFGKYKVPKEKLQNSLQSSKELIQLLVKGEWTYGINNVYENPEFIVFNIYIQKHNICVIYSKKSKEYLYGTRFKGWLSPLGTPKHISSFDDSFISAIEANHFRRFKKTIESNGESKIFDRYPDLFLELSNNDNPVIVFTEYKSF